MAISSVELFKICVLLVAGGFFILGLTSLFWTSWKFFTLAIACDRALLTEVSRLARANEEHLRSSPIQPDKIQSFIKDRMTPSDGTFVPYSDEEAFVQETVEGLRRQGFSQSELDEFIKQSVTAIGEDKDIKGE